MGLAKGWAGIARCAERRVWVVLQLVKPSFKGVVLNAKPDTNVSLALCYDRCLTLNTRLSLLLRFRTAQRREGSHEAHGFDHGPQNRVSAVAGEAVIHGRYTTGIDLLNGVHNADRAVGH